MSSSSLNAIALTPLEIALKESLLPPDFRDVHLYAFSRRTTTPDGATKIYRPMPVVAIASLLKQADYFSKLLTSGFAESDDAHSTSGGLSVTIHQQALDSEYDYESDSDLDEGEFVDFASENAAAHSDSLDCGSGGLSDMPNGVTTPRQVTPGYRQILLPNIAYTTLRACVFYLYTGKVNFKSLRSSPTSWAELPARTDSGVPRCSPKSMFRLAESYGITALQDLAYQALVTRLMPSNIVSEAFSSFYCRYDCLREHAVSVISRHYQDAGVQASLKETVEKVARGELPHASALLISLLGLRLAIQHDTTTSSSGESNMKVLNLPRIKRPQRKRDSLFD